jgi:hypothetical protein
MMVEREISHSSNSRRKVRPPNSECILLEAISERDTLENLEKAAGVKEWNSKRRAGQKSGCIWEAGSSIHAENPERQEFKAQQPEEAWDLRQ